MQRLVLFDLDDTLVDRRATALPSTSVTGGDGRWDRNGRFRDLRDERPIPAVACW
jgi:FMN phosphatase YigB (HAD superfamily)